VTSNWSALSVPELWALVAPIDTDPQWTHVAGWRQALELTTHHLERMAEYRSRIAAVWPPERNEAARAYLAKLDEMVASLQKICDAATANYETVRSVTAAVDMARIQLWLVNDEYAVAGAALRAELTSYARAVMAELGGVLAAATVALVLPPAYAAPRVAGYAATIAPALARARPPTPASPIVAPDVRPSPSSAAGPRPVPGVAPAVRPPVLGAGSGVRPPAPGGAGSARPGLLPRPPGGVIGTPPGTGPRQVSRVNPVGGVHSGGQPLVPVPAQPRQTTAPTARTRSAGPRPAPAAAFRTADGHLVSVRTARQRKPSTTIGVIEPPAPPEEHHPGPVIGGPR